MAAPEASTTALEFFTSAWKNLSKSAADMACGSAPWAWICACTLGVASSLLTSVLSLVTMGGRQVAWAKQAYQVLDIKSCIAEFGHGGHIGQRRAALGRGHGSKACSACPALIWPSPMARTTPAERHCRQRIEHGGVRALVGHVGERQACGFLEQHGGDVDAGAAAGRAGFELAGLGRGDEDGRVGDVGNRRQVGAGVPGQAFVQVVAQHHIVFLAHDDGPLAGGAALVASVMPMVPPAPARLSATTVQWFCSVSFCAMMRERMSVPPPGGKGTIIRTGLLPG
ncbi:hypothetical protein FQA39_LY18918 [Lamprigera yunnana]|nr:hypothetical protein FQA39_LY18918 [Lamprigera yunnana]